MKLNHFVYYFLHLFIDDDDNNDHVKFKRENTLI